MDKKLQDYIHLYIGQPCVNSWFPESHDMYDNGWKLAGIDTMCPRPYKLESKDDFTWSEEIQLILRPLSDITDGEADERSWRGKRGFEYFQANKQGAHFPDDFAWLLSKGFDLFDLIPAGLALDKTKRPSEGKGEKV